MKLAIHSLMQLSTLVMLTLVLSSCQYPNQFQSIERDSSHALLTADPPDCYFDRGPLIWRINNQATSFWTPKRKFRISPGPTVVGVVADKEPYHYYPFSFVAQSGHHYHIKYQGAREAVGLFEITDTRHPPKLLLKAGRDHSPPKYLR